VVGFDDLLPAPVATPGITTIRQPLTEMGLLTAQWVVEALSPAALSLTSSLSLVAVQDAIEQRAFFW
jgi:DNA-binding LacI/PurR family transcriptional regulator